MSKILVGSVLKISGNKTVNVLVKRVHKHSFYHKVVTTRTKFLCHNELPDLSVGDGVEICESIKYSAKKSWKVLKKL
jgi:small subunit ribosomal protein S17